MERPFENLDDRTKLLKLIDCVWLALREDENVQKTWKNDYIELAIQYGGKRLQLKRSDFDLIRNLTIEEIFKKIQPFKPFDSSCLK